jgi:hypothetical protein
VPGDRVACCTNGHVTVQAEGAAAPVELEEPYVFEDDRMVFCAAGTGEAACPPGAEGVLVPEGRLWVMGDHRGSSADSAFHIDDENQGTVPQDKVIGRAFVVVWPLDRAALLSVPDTFDGPLGALPAQALTATPYALGRGRRAAARGAAPPLALPPLRLAVRLSAKAFVVDDAGRLLLLDCTDPDRPGRALVGAARRRRRAGRGRGRRARARGARGDRASSSTRRRRTAAVDAGVDFVFRSVRRWSRCHGRLVRPARPGGGCGARAHRRRAGLDPRLRWWSPHELTDPGLRLLPARVPALLPRLLAGSASTSRSTPGTEPAGRPGWPRLTRHDRPPRAPRGARAARRRRRPDPAAALPRPVHAGEGSWWNTTGGGLDEGETSAQAAVRELREETGLELDEGAVGASSTGG